MTEKDFDDCTAQASAFASRKFEVPTNEEELDAVCNKSFSSLACIRRYTRSCTGTFTRTVSGIFAYDIRRLLKKRCKTPEGRQEFLKHMKCGIPKGRLEPMYKCLDNYIAQLHWTNDNVKREDLVPALCCSLHQAHTCIRNQVSALCESVTGPETTKYLDESVSHAIGEGVEYTCGIYKDLDTCNKSMKKEIWDPLYAIGVDHVKAGFNTNYTSPFSIAIKIFSKLN